MIATPKISYVMAAYNAAPWIEQAIHSALAQTGVEVEIIIVDDASRDETATIVNALTIDSRVILVRRERSGGPASARNIALERTTGDWVGILDADDWIDPSRSSRLIALAEAERCDIVADNLLCVYDDNSQRATPLLAGADILPVNRIDVAGYLDRNRMTGGETNLGFLKPIFKRTRAVRYNERLRIGEDFDFCLRCMISGSDLVFDAAPGYHYRIRSGSLTRQLSPADIITMMAVYENAFSRPLTRREMSADRRFRTAMQGMLSYVACRRDIRVRDWQAVAGHVLEPVFWKAALPVTGRAARRLAARFAML